MLDARTVPENTTVETDVCIVGGGAAGITLAREWSGQSFRVCLLESGGLDYDQYTQDLYKGEKTGQPYFPLEISRLRYFGGSTNHWAGFCQPLDALDFETRDWVPYSGWPFPKTDLLPFYARAQEVCQLGALPYEPSAWETSAEPRLPFMPDNIRTTISQFSPPTRFGRVYRQELTQGRNLSIYLHANVVDIEVNEHALQVTRLRVACLQGTQFWVTARFFILAAGGIENARLLLLSNTVSPAGLGNRYDLVGRFFMDHPGVESGRILPSNRYTPLRLYVPHTHTLHKLPLVASLALTPETLRRERVLNMRVGLKPIFPKSVGLLKRLAHRARERALGEFMRHLGQVILDIDGVTGVMYAQLIKGALPVDIIRLDCQIEPAPNPDSRITLIQERDELGKPRVQLHWLLSPLDKRSLRRTQEILGQEVGRAGLGRLHMELDEDDTRMLPSIVGGQHHMGTTRMHDDPKQGVVDRHGRVHAMANLFIAGSSVFPTAGGVNPTLTIVALSLRLADHIKGLMV